MTRTVQEGFSFENGALVVTGGGGGGGVTSVNGDTGAVTVPVAGRLIGYHVLTGNGTYTPAVGTAAILVRQYSGGGGGGGGNSASGGGGSAGSYAEKYITSPAASYAYTNGAAGAAGGGSGDGGAGGQSTFGSVLTVPGGLGGKAGSPDNISALVAKASIPTGGDLNIQGALGTRGFDTSNTTGLSWSGNGASSPVGSGGAGSDSGAGTAATGYAAGGGGGVSAAGAAGTAGVTLVYEYS